MAKRNTKNLRDGQTPKILRSYDIYSLEKRIYDLEKNSGGGGGSTITTDTLYAPSGTPDIPASITLADDYDKYNIIMMVGVDTYGDLHSITIDTGSLATGRLIGICNNSDYTWYSVTDKKTLTKGNTSNQISILKILGYKW